MEREVLLNHAKNIVRAVRRDMDVQFQLKVLASIVPNANIEAASEILKKAMTEKGDLSAELLEAALKTKAVEVVEVAEEKVAEGGHRKSHRRGKEEE